MHRTSSGRGSNMKASIVIVDDEKSIRSAVTLLLTPEYQVSTAATCQAALQLVRQETPDLVLLDIGLPDGNGIDLLKIIKKERSDLTAVMISAFGETRSVVEAVRAGAYDYLVKPIDAQELTITVANALEARTLKNKIRAIQQPMIDRYRLGVVGKSAHIRKMVDTAARAARSIETPVLIDGESGTGKGVLARALHFSVDDTPGPFVTVNCGAIAADLVESELFGYENGAFTGARSQGKAGHFEAAAGGTLLLDEIGNMPAAAQAKLLGVLEDRKFMRIGGSREIAVRCRVVAATNADLQEAVVEGGFRRDLFYRLNVIRLTMPPLRERREDILPLTEHFIDHFNRKFGKRFGAISETAARMLLTYPWPGNVRELKNCLERIVLLEDSESLQEDHLAFITATVGEPSRSLPAPGAAPLCSYRETVVSLIKTALDRSNGNVVESARLLAIPAHKLRYRIKKYGLNTIR